jgi:hypothetical protein
MQAAILLSMVEEPQVNDVRLGDDGELEFFDGTAWIPYSDVPGDAGSPNALTREDR